MDWYELIKLFLWSLWVTTVIAGIGVIADLWLINFKFKPWLKPKWLWNLVEFVAIFGLINCRGWFPLPWWHMAPLYASMMFVWSAVHDCWLGWGLNEGPFYLGQSKWDRFFFRIFNQFGLPAGLNFLIVKLFWGFLAAAAFFSL